jgi:precorrin-6Y C5,15-methyltransferase (decarboxylating)
MSSSAPAARWHWCGSHLAPTAELIDMDGKLGQVPGWMLAARDAGKTVVALATGDPLCHGIASWLTGKLGRDGFEILPAVSTLQLAFARFKTPGRTSRFRPATPPMPANGSSAPRRARPLQADAGIALHPPRGAVHRPGQQPGAAGARADHRRLRRRGEACRWPAACCCPTKQFSPTCCGTTRRWISRAQRRAGRARAATARIPPHPLSASKTSNTSSARRKRADHQAGSARLSLAKLRLKPDAIVWDIGAGSGSVGLECARLAPHGHVWAIEKERRRRRQRARQRGPFPHRQLHAVEGKAPAQLDTWPDPDAVFIGGSGGELAEADRLILARLKPAGRLVMNFVTIENLATATAALKDCRRRLGCRPAAGQPQPAHSRHAPTGRAEPGVDRHRNQGIMMTNKPYGKLIGASLGPGDPELITRRAWAALQSGARWLYPVKKAEESSYALSIVERGGIAIPADAEELVFPMTRDAEILAKAWARAATRTVELLAEGPRPRLPGRRRCLHLRHLRPPRPRRARTGAEVEVETIPGVSSFAAAAAATGITLAEEDETSR